MTTPTTATEAAQRAAQLIADTYGLSFVKREHIKSIIAAQFATIAAKAEAADRLAEAMNKFRNSPNERGHTVADFWRLADNVTDALVAYNAYRALAAEGQVQG